MLLSYCAKVPLYTSRTAYGHLSHNQASFLPGTYRCPRDWVPVLKKLMFSLSLRRLCKKIFWLRTHPDDPTAQDVSNSNWPKSSAFPVLRRNEMLLTVPQCCWCHLSKKAHPNYSDGPPATHATCFFYLECFVGSIICTWTSCFTDSTSLLLALFCIRKMSLIKFHFCLMQPESHVYDFFFPFCKYKHLKRKYKAEPMIASRQKGWWYITTADNEI